MKQQLYAFLPAHVEGRETLVELALNLRWSWNHSADELWGQLDPELWELTHNPRVILQRISLTKLKSLAADPGFCQKVKNLVQIKNQYIEASTWFQQTHAGFPLTCVAYFSMGKQVQPARLLHQPSEVVRRSTWIRLSS